LCNKLMMMMMISYDNFTMFYDKFRKLSYDNLKKILRHLNS